MLVERVCAIRVSGPTQEENVPAGRRDELSQSVCERPVVCWKGKTHAHQVSPEHPPPPPTDHFPMKRAHKILSSKAQLGNVGGGQQDRLVRCLMHHTSHGCVFTVENQCGQSDLCD